MTLGFLGSKFRLNCVRRVMNAFFPDIETIYIEDECFYYNTFVEKKLKDIKNDIDGMIFCGELQHSYYNNIFFPDKPCQYFKKDWSSLMNAFLKASLKGIDFLNTSVDSYAMSSIENILHDLERDHEAHQIKIIKRRAFEKSYSDSLVNTHIKHYESGTVQGCITALFPVYKTLQEKNIPSIYVYPTTESIFKTIQSVIETHNNKHEEFGLTAILIIRILPKNEYSYIRQDEYLYMHEKIKVAEEVYYFARNANAAVVSESNGQFIILMNKKDFLEYTNGFQRFYLIDSIHSNTNCDVQIGIGYGSDPSEAKYNANIAIERLEKNDRNLTYIVSTNKAIVGPLNFLQECPHKENLTQENLINQLAKLTGLSQGLIFNLYTVMEKQKKDCFTSSELSKELSISQRSSNRLLRKLEENGIASLIGKHITGHSGRPSDVYKIEFNKGK